MHLHDHAGLHFILRQCLGHSHHGHFYNVRCRPLDRRVDCISLSESAYGCIVGLNVGQVTSATEHGLRISFLPNGFNTFRRKSLELSKLKEVGIDDFPWLHDVESRGFGPVQMLLDHKEFQS